MPLVDAYSQQRAALTAVAVRLAVQAVIKFAGWYSTGEIKAMTGQLAAQMESAQRHTASLTDAYLTRVLTIMRGQPMKAKGAIGITDLRQGVTHPGVYGRLADQYRYEVAMATPPEVAIQHVAKRAELLARTDIDLAFRAQVPASLDVKRVTGYRRVIHPELSKGGTCGLCIAASDRTYARESLMPLHGRCECSVLPVIGDNDPAHAMNQTDLNKLYNDAGSTAAADLKRTRYDVHDHSELGPTLTLKGDSWRSKRAVDDDTGKPITVTPEKARSLIAAFEASNAKAAGNPALAKMVDFNNSRIADLRDQL